MNYNFCNLLSVLKNHEESSEESIINEYTLALAENAQTTLKILFWFKIRYKNSTYIFRKLIKYSYTLIPEVLERNLWALITFCDDLDIISIIASTPMSKCLIRYIRSENKRGKKFSNNLMTLVGLTPINYTTKKIYKSKIKDIYNNNDLLSSILEDNDLSAIA